MAGQAERYQHQPYFYSDLFDLGYEAVGELDASLDIVEDWKEPFRKGWSIICAKDKCGRPAVEHMGSGRCCHASDCGKIRPFPRKPDRTDIRLARCHEWFKWCWIPCEAGLYN